MSSQIQARGQESLDFSDFLTTASWEGLPPLAIAQRYTAGCTALDAFFNTIAPNLASQGILPQLDTLLAQRAALTDRALLACWTYAELHLNEQITLFAVGGYGRSELFPHSDIDLLILYQNELNQTQQAQLEGFVQCLWDIGPQISQSVRSLKLCLELAGSDHTVLTALLDSRCLSETNASTSTKALRDSLLQKRVMTRDAFFAHKLDEYTQRHAKHADTEYNLEPNIKEAPGGLRDVHSMIWIASYVHGAISLKQLKDRGTLDDDEFFSMNRGYHFCAALRYGLHCLTGRDENRLLFDYQKRLASYFGFTGSKSNQGVEQLMKHYYRHAASTTVLTDILLEHLDEERAGQRLECTPINQRFQYIDGKIAITHDEVFERQPSAVLEIFYLLGQSPNARGIRSHTIRRLRRARSAITPDFGRDPKNTALFLKILRSPYRLFTQLKRMRRIGILGRYLPEFGQVVGQMQYDLFHIYTVDAHALLVVQNMRLLRHTNMRSEFPLAAKLVHTIADRTLLYIAGLYHDIAKGRGGDHSILGAEDAQRFCERHSLSSSDTDLIVWLVRYHLLMSTTAQKMDISDVQVIEEFAQKVQDLERLNYLYLLTVCDIGATNPKLLNPWRLSLLNQLYSETSQYFRRTLHDYDPFSTQARIARTQYQAAGLLGIKGIYQHQIQPLWNLLGTAYFTRYPAEDIAWHCEAILKQGDSPIPLVLVGLTEAAPSQIYTQIFIYAPDTRHLFANSVAALSKLGLNILDARILTSDHDFTLNTFVVDDNDTGIITQTPQVYQQIRQRLQDAIIKGLPDSAWQQWQIPRRLQHFDVPAKVSIHNRLDRQQSVIGIEALDRPGLLAMIGATLARHDITIHAAKILTFGERAEDYFFVSYQKQGLCDRAQCQALYQDLTNALISR